MTSQLQYIESILRLKLYKLRAHNACRHICIHIFDTTWAKNNCTQCLCLLLILQFSLIQFSKRPRYSVESIYVRYRKYKPTTVKFWWFPYGREPLSYNKKYIERFVLSVLKKKQNYNVIHLQNDVYSIR